MEVLSAPCFEIASARGSKGCTCDYCGHAMQFLIEAEGRNAECPNCGRIVCLGAANIKPRMEKQRVMGERRRISKRSTARRALRVLGWTLFSISAFALLTLALTPFSANEALLRITYLLFNLVCAGFGLVFMIEGSRIETSWICSVCNHELGSWHDIACRSCTADLS
jgi:hypothetical protein